MNHRVACLSVVSPVRGPGLTLNLCSLVLALSMGGAAQAQEMPDLTPPDTGSILPDVRPAGSLSVKEIDVRFSSGNTVDRARILSLMRLKVGETWTQDKEDEDLRALYKSGNFINLSISKVQVAGGLKLTVTAEARPAMGDLVFQGNTAFHTDRLKDTVEFKSGGVVDDTKLSEAKQKILELYKKKGYPDAVVTYAVEPGPQAGFSRIVFRIDEGGRGVIDKVRFEGNTVFSDFNLKGVIESDNRNWLKVWDLKRKLDREKLEKDLAAIHDHYGNYGYFDARATADTVPTGDKITLVFHVEEGPRYTTAQVNVTGNKLYETSVLLPVFQLEAGKVFSLEGMKMDMETISEYYGARGYADARVTPKISKSGTDLHVTYAIEEGEKFKVGRINIKGNNDTRDAVIRRELTIAPEDEYNTIKIRKSIAKVKNLDYFADNTGVDFMAVTSAQGPEYKDLDITVNEKKTGSLQFGAGFSSIDSIVGMVELTQRNFDVTNWPTFTGGGQRFRMSARIGSERKDFLLSLTEPYFMEKRLSVGGDLFWTEKTYLSDVFDQRDAGFTLNVRTPLGDSSDLRLGYTVQNVDIYNIDMDGTGVDSKTSQAIRDEKGKYLQSRLSASVVFDNRNSFQAPTKGHKISLETTFSGSFLGGDVDTYSAALSGQKYWKLPYKSVFSLEGRVAVVDSVDGGRVPIFERQFLGGANNLRGFEYRKVGHRISTTDDGGTLDRYGEPLGGNTSAYLTAELTVPVIRKFRAAVFVDAGFVNKDSWDFDTKDFNADAGLGVRFTLPVLGPIKLDYGIPFVADDANDNSGRFNFSVDYKF